MAQVRDKDQYSFKSPANLERFLLGDEVLRDIINTSAFQRLRDIRFLGGIDFLLVKSPNGRKARYTRYQHSIGVAYLATLYCDINSVDFKDRQLICSAALLHDIGHAPLSHSLESVFLEFFGIDHHAATEMIIKGDVNIGNGLHEILKWRGIDCDRLISFINGQEKCHGEFFSGPINFDTIEGILRSYSYAKRDFSKLNPRSVTKSAIKRSGNYDRDAVDDFWRLKDLIYTKIINSHHGVAADYICKYLMTEKINAFSLDDYFTTERDLFSKLPNLKHILTSRDFFDLVTGMIKRPIAHKVRRFYIDEAADFFKKEDTLRYRQTKSTGFVVLGEVNLEKNGYDSGSLFE